MSTKLEKELTDIIKNDEWMISILEIVRDLELNDCWIGAGFVRNKIWDVKHHKNRTPLNDIDVIYFNELNISKKYDLEIEQQLQNIKPELNWSVKNQARMHIKNNHSPYSNCYDAISFWPETATSIAIKLNSNNQIHLIAPYGLVDLFSLLVIPTPNFNLTTFNNRIHKKRWFIQWPKLRIETNYKS